MTPPRIQPLSEALQNHIAAGEVVERPASVLKELLDNALDAGATRIDVHVDGGGQTRIHVADNGHGIVPEDLPLALTRHATSKIRAVEDLFAIRTLGFRGEALASIASVARLSLASSTDAGEGMAIEASFGHLGDPSPRAMPRGTEVTVRDLFANLPARLKFLRTPATEARKCQETFQRLALIHLQTEMCLTMGGRLVHHLSPAADLASRLAQLWPQEVVSAMQPVCQGQGAVRVRGLLGDPSLAQARPDRILLAVNGRPIQDKLLLRAVREAYSGKLLRTEYPQAVLHLELDPELVDVNVHPAKIEVRFQDEGLVFRTVLATLSRSLRPAPVQVPDTVASRRPSCAPPMTTPKGPKFAHTRLAEHLGAAEAPAPFGTPAPHALQPSTQLCPKTTDKTTFPPPQPEAVHFPSPSLPWRYAGQVAATYLVLLGDNEILLLDQHAAHERVLWHTLVAAPGSTQDLLVPLSVPLHPSHENVLEALWGELHALGFGLTRHASSLEIHRIPHLLTVSQAKGFLTDVLLGKARDLHTLRAQMACHGAVRAGDPLAPAEAEALLAAWWAVPERDFCPHGRPTVVRLGTEALEKLFKRRG